MREVCENYNLDTGRMVTIGTQGLHPLLHQVHLQPTKAQVINLVAMTAHQAVVLVVAARNQE